MDSRCIAIFLTGDGVPVENGKPLMLQNVLFCPALTWCMRAWMKEGVGRTGASGGSRRLRPPGGRDRPGR